MTGLGASVRVIGIVGLALCLGPGTAPSNDLHAAVRAGGAAGVATLIAGAAAIDEVDLDGSPLQIAVARNDAVIAAALLEAGADPEQPGDPAGAHALHAAVHLDAPAMVTLLLAHGAEVDARDAEERTPLMVAAAFARPEAAAIQIENGADIRAADALYGDTVLHWAAYGGSVPIAERLLAGGADVNSPSTTNGATPIFYAAKLGHLEMAKFLIANGADTALRNKLGDTMLPRSRGLVTPYLLEIGVPR